MSFCQVLFLVLLSLYYVDEILVKNIAFCQVLLQLMLF